MKGLQNGIPIAMLAAMASAQGLGGRPTVDTGNGVGVGFSNQFSNEVDNFNKDDHSADVHTETNIIKAPPHPHGGPHGPEHGGHDGHGEGEGAHGHQKRGGVIDSGNSASFDFDNEFTNEVNNANLDDHSLDVHKNTNIVTPPPHPHGHGGHGPEHKRRDEEEPHGPSTIDTGNDADFTFTNEFHNEVNNYNGDNHSVDVDKHTNVHVAPPHGGPHESHGHDGQEGHHKRAYRPDADSAAEPGTVDTGNTANTQVSNSVDSKTNSANIDDHSVKVHSDVNETVGAPHHHEHHEGGHEEPGENHQEEPSEPADDQEEPSKPVEHQPAQPVEHPEEEHKEPVPTCTTLTREVVHTVVRTLQGHSEATHAPQQPAEVNTPAAQPEEPKEHGESGHGDPSHQAETPKPTGSEGSHQEDSGHAEPSHEAESPKPTGSDGSHQEESGHDDHSPRTPP
ncbi:GPI anchored protein, partial [Aspergillus nomiae NRRL 13137]